MAGRAQGELGRAPLPRQRDHRREVNQGAVAFGIVNQYYWYRMRAEIGAAGARRRSPTWPRDNPGYVVDVSGAAILKSSKHQADGQKFLAFLVSKQAQEIIAHPGTGPGESISFEYPLASGVTTMAAGDAVLPAAAVPHHHRPAREGHARRSRCSTRPGCCDRPDRRERAAAPRPATARPARGGAPRRARPARPG